MRVSLCAFLIAGTVVGQTTMPQTKEVPTVRASGRATVSAKPDQVRIDIGVVAQAKTAQLAAAENAARFSEVVAALKKAAGPGGDVQTVSYNVQPNYRYPREGGTPTIVSYTAQNTVRVTSPRVEQAGEIIDVAAAKGSNNVSGIHFSVKDERGLRAQALREAARDAKAAAEAMATGVGLKILRVIRLEDGGAPQIRPILREMAPMAAAMDSGVPTPVASGTIDVEASVTVICEVGN